MNGFLLDTNVISELRKGDRCHKSVRSWFESIPEDELFLSVLVFGEIRRGVERIRVHDPISARSLQKWLEEISTDFADRIMGVDVAIADQWGRLGIQQPVPVLDAMLAATALVHDLTVATRDTDGFKNTGARVINPFVVKS
jgi:toxin FitB